MTSSLIVAASALLSFAAAAPVQNDIRSGSLEARQAPSCNIGTGVNNAVAYDSSCWNTLNITPYLTNWKTTTPTCTDAENSGGQTLSCCVASEPWSTCFLRLATRKANAYDCTQFTTTTCTFPAALDPGLDPTIASQVNYIVLNIMMINSFFVGYSKALQNAMTAEAANLNTMLSSSGSNLANVNVNTQNFMAALTLGLAFPKFSAPKNYVTTTDDGTTTTEMSVSKRNPQDPNTGTSTGSAPQSSASIVPDGCEYSWIAQYYQNGRHHRRQTPDNCPNDTAESNPSGGGPFQLVPSSPPVIIFNQALQQSPNVASAMWPSPPNSATDSLGDLASSHPADITQVLNAGLQLIMGDIGTFTAFAGDGIFSAPLSPTEQPSSYTTGLTGAVDTYIFSEMLAGASLSATPGQIVPTNPCSSGSVCSTYYWSPVTQRQYTFSGSTLYTLVTQAQSTMQVDLPTLFDGAYNCTFAGQAGGSVVGLRPDSSLDVACLSVLPMYIKGDCPQGATQVGGKCPFG